MSGIDEPDASSEEEPAAGSTSSADPALSGDEAAEVESEPEPEPEQESESDPEPEQESEPEPVLSVLDLLTAERDQHLNDLQRVTAEFANFRKQTGKRNAEIVRQAAARVMQAILPVLDACDAAALQEVAGVEPIAAQLRSVLESEGLEIIDQTEAFDPNRHEAAMSEPADEDQVEPMVSEVLRTGYAFNGRILRAAMVKVKG